MTTYKKVCKRCWKEFEAFKAKAMFCSTYCKEHQLKTKICDNCWKEFQTEIRSRNCCSDECTKQLRVKKIQKTNLERYWVPSALQNNNIKGKIKQTCLERYGVDNPAKLKAIKEKIKNTRLKKYWVDHIAKLTYFQKKKEDTLKEHYWVRYMLQSKLLKDRAQKSCVEKYWTKNPSQNKSIRDKQKQTMTKRYWSYNSMSSDILKEKIKQTNLNKYWFECVLSNKSIREKIKNTNLQKYWVEWYCMTDEFNKNFHKLSKEEEKFLNKYLLWYNYERQFPIHNRQYDFKIWDVLLELNPFPFHNVTWSIFWTPIEKDYHYNKTLLARENWYRCIHIFDWDNPEKVVMLLDQNKTKLYARKCNIVQLTYEEWNYFLEKYHLQNWTKKNKNDIYLWLVYEWELVMVMSFGKPRYNKHYEWEILRLCTHKDYSIIGWASKIFKHFLDITNTNSVISYCDMSKFDGKVYEQLWFELYKWNMPSKHRLYIGNNKDNKRLHITDNYLRQRWFDQTVWQYFGKFGKWTSNDELMKQFDYVEIYDCWQATYVWTKNKNSCN